MTGSVHRWRVLWATFVAYLFDSYDLTVLALALPVLLKLLGMSLPEAGLLGTATALGAMAGGVVFGLVAENYGRRFALVASLIWLGLGMAAVYVVNSWGEWMVLRFITGLAIGGVWGPCAALIAQHWSAEHRGRAASFVFSSFAIGAAVAAAVGRVVLGAHWQWLFVGGAVSIPAAVLAWFLIPSDAVVAANTASGGAAPSSVKPAPSPVIPAQAGIQSGASAAPVRIGAIFSGGIAPITLAATLVSVVNLAGYWGAAFWIPTFLTKERGVDLSTMLGFQFVQYVGMFIGFQFFGWLADAIGRRRSMMAAFATCAVSIGVYIVVLDPVFLFWWGAVVGFGLCGAGGILGAYYAELFPERIRAYAGGFCWNMGRLGSMAAPFTMGVIGKAYGLQSGLAVTCAIYAVGVLMLLLLPETFKREAGRPVPA